MIPDPVAAHRRTRAALEGVLHALAQGQSPRKWESETVDLKEEAGRRGRGGEVFPGQQRNDVAAEKLAVEVRCFANSPGGGVLILGVEDKTQELIGTALDAEWLRQRLNALTSIAPVVEEHHVRGVRLLALIVPEAETPVEDPNRGLRWRVGDHCVAVDRAQWWTHRALRIGVDPMAAGTDRHVTDVTPTALFAVRAYLREGGEPDVADDSDESLLTRLGVLRPDSTLSRAGALVLCPSPSARIELSRLDVAGGDVTLAYVPAAGTSLLESLREVEGRLDTINAVRPTSRGFVETASRALPARAVREAILNGLTHRDWFAPEPTRIRWIEADDHLEVTSPGGFTGGVTADNALTTRHPRYPALADLFQALRLVDRQGVGVPRMYQTMLSEGHPAPLLEEAPGPRVRTVLAGKPVVPLLPGLLAAVHPAYRRRDVRVVLLLDALLRRPFLTLHQAARVLQTSSAAAALALESLSECRVEGEEVFRTVADAWSLSGHLLDGLTAGRYGSVPPRSDLLWYRSGAAAAVRRTAQEWLEVHDKITSGDVAALTGMWQANASKTLSTLAEAGDLLVRGPGRGRAAHFVALRSSADPSGVHSED